MLVKLDSEGVLIVASANNHAVEEGIAVRRYPAKFADPSDKYGGIENMMVVSATNWKTLRADFAHYSPFVATFAPGDDITCPADSFVNNGNPYKPCHGTSFGKSTTAMTSGRKG